MANEPKSFDFRESTRTPLRAEVQLQFDRDEDSVGYSANLSPGGMFVTVRDPKPIGTLLRFVVDLMEAEPVRGYGEVVWIRVKYHGPDRPSGMGIRFRHLEDDGKRRIEGFILRLTAQTAEPDLGDETIAAAPDPEATAHGLSPTAAAVVGIPNLEPSRQASDEASEPMAEVWISEPVAADQPPSDTDELVPMPSVPDNGNLAGAARAETTAEEGDAEMLLPPTDSVAPAASREGVGAESPRTGIGEAEPLAAEALEPQPPASEPEAETREAEALEAQPPASEPPENEEPASEPAVAREPEAEAARGETLTPAEETLAAGFVTDDFSVDTAVIEDPELLAGKPAASASREEGADEADADAEGEAARPTKPFAPDTGELSAAFGDLYPGSIEYEKRRAAEAESEGSEDDEAAFSAAAGLDLDDSLHRPAPWLTTPIPEPELEETMDGLVRTPEAAPPVASASANGKGEPLLGTVEADLELPELTIPEPWEPEPRERSKAASGLPPGSARTSIAGTAVAEEPWKKTFFGMPSRTFFRALMAVAVLGLAVLFLFRPVATWLAGGYDEERVADVDADGTALDGRVPGGSVISTQPEPAAEGATSDPGSTQGDQPAGGQPVSSESAAGPGVEGAPGPAPAAVPDPNKYFRAPVLSPAEGGLDLTVMQLEEGVTLRELLAQHEAAREPSPMREVTDVVWRRLGNETVVSVTGDGALAAARYSHERMPGAQPRELVRILGIRGVFPQPMTEAGTPQLSAVRVGYHQAAQRELHVVLDLPRADVRVVRIELTGAGLEVHLSAP